MVRGVADRTPENVTHYLQGIDFPAGKADLLAFAESHEVDARVLGAIRRMPDREYTDMEDVAAQADLTS